MVSSFSFFTRQCPYVSATSGLQEQNNGVWFLRDEPKYLQQRPRAYYNAYQIVLMKKMYIFNNQSWLNQAFVLFNVFGLFLLIPATQSTEGEHCINKAYSLNTNYLNQ